MKGIKKIMSEVAWFQFELRMVPSVIHFLNEV